MSKSIQQLRQLAENPFYNLTEAEKQQLAEADSQDNAQAPKGVDTRPKVSSSGNATVKEIGQLNKHEGDPVSPATVSSSVSAVKERVNNGA